MKRFLGWLFAFFAVMSFFGGFADPELGVGGGIFGAVFWGVIAHFLLKKDTKNSKITTVNNAKYNQKVKLASAPESLLDELEDLEELTELNLPVQTVRFECNSCGAKNEVRSTGSEIRCEYCDSPSIPATPSV
jgi:hypothetical protein